MVMRASKCGANWPGHSTCLLLWSVAADQELARLGLGDGEWSFPREGGEGETDGFQLGGGDQEGQATRGGEEGGGYWEDFGETLYGPEGYYVEGG